MQTMLQRTRKEIKDKTVVAKETKARVRALEQSIRISDEALRTARDERELALRSLGEAEERLRGMIVTARHVS